MDLPTSSSPEAAKWAGLSPLNRSRVASLFLRLRMVAPETKAASPSFMWREVVELVEQHPAAQRGGGSLSDIARFCGDPAGLAFIDHMDAIAREAVVEHLLPPGSLVYGCIETCPKQEGGSR